MYCTVNSMHIFAIKIGVRFLLYNFQASIVVSRNQNLSSVLHPVGNWCKRSSEPGKNPKDKEDIEFKNNEDEKLELFSLKDKRLRWSPVFK